MRRAVVERVVGPFSPEIVRNQCARASSPRSKADSSNGGSRTADATHREVFGFNRGLLQHASAPLGARLRDAGELRDPTMRPDTNLGCRSDTNFSARPLRRRRSLPFAARGGRRTNIKDHQPQAVTVRESEAGSSRSMGLAYGIKHT